MFFKGVFILDNFAKRLLQLREQKGISNQVIADLLNVQIRVVQRYIKGETTPPLEKAIILADFFDVSLDYLVGRSNDPIRH